MSVASETGVATSTTRLRAARTARRSRRKRGSHACEQVPRRFREASPKQPWGAFPPHPQGRLARQRAASHVGTGEGAQVAPEAALPRASKVEGFFERAELQLAPYNRGGLFTQWDTRHPSHQPCLQLHLPSGVRGGRQRREEEGAIAAVHAPAACVGAAACAARRKRVQEAVVKPGRRTLWEARQKERRKHRRAPPALRLTFALRGRASRRGSDSGRVEDIVGQSQAAAPVTLAFACRVHQ